MVTDIMNKEREQELKDSLDAYLKDIDDKRCLAFRRRLKSMWNKIKGLGNG